MRTRIKWILISVEIIVIYSTLSLVRSLTKFLDERGMLSLTIYCIAALFCMLFITYIVKKKPPALNIVFLVPVLAAYGLLFLKMKILVERVHLIEYGLLGFLLTSALYDKLGKIQSAAGAFFSAAIVGYIDEVIQYFLPNRVYDLRDVGFNALSGGFGIAFFVILHWIHLKKVRHSIQPHSGS